MKRRAIFYLTGFILLGMSLWTHRFFGRVSVEQALWTISFGTQGVLAADSVYIKRFITWVIIWPINLTVLFLVLEYFLFRQYKRLNAQRYFSYFILMGGAAYFTYQYSLLQYVLQSHQSDKDYFALNYTDANKIRFQAHNPKSLVLIYVESLEATYANPELFGHDLLHKLSLLQRNNLVFSQFKQVSGTGWTIGGIVSTQCAVPLKGLTIMGNNRVGENIDSFLPNVKCLGDILTEHGYKNVFMEGSSLLIGGKRKFLEKHHYDERVGLEEWLVKGYHESDMNHWGLPDDELLKQAKNKFDELMQGKQLFNLTLLTVDTHGVTGQLNKTCKAEGYSDFKGVVECTSNMVADFVNYIISKGALARVNVVVIGDHIAMSNDANDELQASKSRTIFNVIISDRKFKKNTDEIVHFDLLPTLLDTLGFTYPGYKLGLGSSAIGQHKNIFSENRITEIEKQAGLDSEFYNQLWLPKEKSA